MSSTTHVLRVELSDSPSRVNGVRLQGRLLVNGIVLQSTRILTTSLWPKLFKDIEWYLEEFIYSDAFSLERATNVERDFKTACRRLAVDLELEAVLSQSPFTSLDHVELQIVNNADDLYDLAFAFPWELLEHTDIWSKTRKSITVSRLIVEALPSVDHTVDIDLLDLSINGSVDGPVVKETVTDDQAPNEDCINILLVLARAADTLDGRPRDIPPFVALEAITQLSNRLAGRRLNVEVARPGTWASVKESLNKYPPGHYSLVHFDVHGGTRAKAPSLSFADPDGSGRLKKEFVATVARAVKKAAVQNVVLNACGSASNAHGAEANPSHIFLQHGVSSVVGMSHRASAQAMALFLKHFYEELVTSASFSAATAVGRQVLSDNKSRKTNQQVDRDLSDYILPVLYTSDVLSTSLTATRMEPEDPAELAPVSKTTYMEGRDFDILKLENVMRDSPIVCVFGPAGIGKSFLLLRAADVWQQTGLFDVCVYVDLTEGHVKSLEDFQRVVDGTKPSRRLVIVDNIQDAIPAAGIEKPKPLSKAEWIRIQAFVAVQSDKYILASRVLSTFVESVTRSSKAFALKGFHPLDSLMLLRRELSSQPNQWSANDRQSAGLLLDMLQHNPLAIHIMIPWIVSLKVGIHEFFEGVIDWRYSTEGSGYWQTLGRRQFQFSCLVDISRIYLRLDTCGQFCWLWIALFWDHGPQVSTTLVLIDMMAQGLDNAKQSAALSIALGQEHGLFEVVGTGGFIRHVNPLFTIWIRYCLLHALRALRDLESTALLGTFKENLSIGNWRTVISGNNPLRTETGDAISSLFTAEMQKGYEAQHGFLKAYWAGVFSDTLVDYKDSSDLLEKSARTREMRFNYLGCFNTLMGSQYVLDQARMQFVELRLYWMMARECCDAHETQIHSERILKLMEYMTSRLDLSQFEPWRTEAGLGLLLIPIQRASLTLSGNLPIHRQMFQVAEKIWKSCEVRYGANIPSHIAMQRPFMQIIGGALEGGKHPHMRSMKEVFSESFEHLTKVVPDFAQNINHSRDRWMSWVDTLTDEIEAGTISIDRLRDAMEDMRDTNFVAFDNPFNAVAQDYNIEKDQSKWSDSLAEALQVENFARATKLLKLMIKDALKKYEWDKARQLLDVFWGFKSKYTLLPADDLQEFVDLDATTSVQWELEQTFMHDAPADGLRTAFEHAKKVHSSWNSDDPETLKHKTMMNQMIPLMERVLGPSLGTADSIKTLQSMAELGDANPWLKEMNPSWDRSEAMLEIYTKFGEADRRARELAEAVDFAGAREQLQKAVSQMEKMHGIREEILPGFRRPGDVPEELVLRKSHFDTLTAFGVSAFGHTILGNVTSAAPLGLFQEAMQIAEKMEGASLSELPVGYASSIRQTRSYLLEVTVLIKTDEDDLPGAMKACQELLGTLTAVGSDLPPAIAKKVQWYRDLNARLGCYFHARQWRVLTDSFKPHLAKLQLKRIGTLFGSMDFDGVTDDGPRFWSFGMGMSACTGLQLEVLRLLGAQAGNDFWQRCRAVLPNEDKSTFMFNKFGMAEVVYVQGFLEITGNDVD